MLHSRDLGLEAGRVVADLVMGGQWGAGWCWTHCHHHWRSRSLLVEEVLHWLRIVMLKIRCLILVEMVNCIMCFYLISVLWNRRWENFLVFQDKRLLGFLIRNLDDCLLVIVVIMLQMFIRR